MYKRQAERRLQVAVDHALAKLDQSGDAPEREKLAEAWRTSGRAPAAQRDDKIRIAVLPFAQHDAIGGDFFLADGVTDELGFRLGGISSLALVGRTSIASVVASGGGAPGPGGRPRRAPPARRRGPPWVAGR